jgi:heptosyltransferase II
MSLPSKLGSKILLRSPNWLGDAVMVLPAVQFLLAHACSNTHVSVLTPAKLADFWKLVPGLHSILIVDDNIAITADNLKPHAFDSAILFPNSLRSALEPWLAGIPKRYGYPGHNRRWLLTETLHKPSRTQGYRHQKHDYLDLVQALLSLSNLKSQISTVDTPLPKTSPSPLKTPYLVVCPGAEYGSAKRWLVERYAAVAKELISRHQLHLIILGSTTDIPVSQTLTSHLSLPTAAYTNLTGQTSLAEFLNLIAHATLVLCNDSGSMHVAAAFGTKAVALFGSTEPKLTGPISNSVTVLRHHVPCSPCFLRECPIDFRCMKAITAEDVTSASEALL